MSSCTLHDRQSHGFRIQSISPSAIVMLEDISRGSCILPRNINISTLSASELLYIRQTFSACAIVPRALSSIDASTQLAILQIKNRNDDPFLIYSLGRGPGEGILDTNFGWDNSGVWFSGNATKVSNLSYPIFTDFTIPPDQQVEVTVDFVYNDNCSDFGLCFYQDDTAPEWSWGTNETRIACEYNCQTPVINGLTESNDREEDIINDLGTYTCNVIYNPNSNPNIIMNTLFNGTIIDTITLNNQVLTSDYRIGFCADQDDTDFRTYIKDLTININNGESIYRSTLQNITIPLAT